MTNATQTRAINTTIPTSGGQTTVSALRESELQLHTIFSPIEAEKKAEMWNNLRDFISKIKGHATIEVHSTFFG